MVVLVLWVDVQSQRQFVVTLQSRALVVTLEYLFQIPFSTFGSIAFSFLLNPLAFAGDKDLVLTGLVLLACGREVAKSHA